MFSPYTMLIACLKTPSGHHSSVTSYSEERETEAEREKCPVELEFSHLFNRCQHYRHIHIFNYGDMLMLKYFLFFI